MFLLRCSGGTFCFSPVLTPSLALIGAGFYGTAEAVPSWRGLSLFDLSWGQIFELVV